MKLPSAIQFPVIATTTVMILCGLIGIGMSGIIGAGRDRVSVETFHAWQKVNPSYSLTYDEWQRLVRNQMLPASPHQEQ